MGSCNKPAETWVLAVCGGMMSLFKKLSDGKLRRLVDGGESIASIENSISMLIEAEKSGQFNQLILVGGANDITWAQALLPQSVTGHLVAEIHYPLLPNWFRDTPSAHSLASALDNVFTS